MLNIWLKITKHEPVYAYKRHAYKQICTSNSLLALLRLHATTVDCAHELINGNPGLKEETAKVLQNNIQGVLNKVGEGGKNGMINKRGVPYI